MAAEICATPRLESQSEPNGLAKYCMLYRLLMHPGREIVAPEEFSAAGGELLVLAIVVSWIITAILNPDMLVNNPLKDAVGYNNLCVGWDMPPATYVAAPLYALLIYFYVRYMHLDLLRAQLTSGLTAMQASVCKYANLLVVIGYCISSLIFVISPMTSPMLHSAAFIQLMLLGWIGYAANFYETRPEHIPKGGYVFLSVFLFATIAFPICAVYQLVKYDPESGVPGGIPWYVTAAFDYLWFACTAIKGFFRPRGPSIKFTFQLAADADFSAEEVATMTPVSIGRSKTGEPKSPKDELVSEASV